MPTSAPDQGDNDEADPAGGTGLAALAIGVAALFLVLGRIFFFESWDAAGPFGDYFAVIGTVANAVALLVALRALTLQRAELRLQRQELKESRQAQQDQAAAQGDLVVAIQEATLLQQQSNETQRALVDAQNNAATLSLMGAYAEVVANLGARGQARLWLEEELSRRGIKLIKTT